MSFWKSVNDRGRQSEDFSEIDTFGVGSDVNLNNLASFDLADIIGDEHSLTNTDYINNNHQEKQERKDVDEVTLSRVNIQASKSATERPNSSTKENEDLSIPQKKEENQQESAVTREPNQTKRRYPCIVCKKKFSDKSRMKEHE